MSLVLAIILLVLLIWLGLGQLGTRITEIDPGWTTHVGCLMLGGVFLIIAIRDERHPSPSL